jgi:hypothetical protein
MFDLYCWQAVESGEMTTTPPSHGPRHNKAINILSSFTPLYVNTSLTDPTSLPATADERRRRLKGALLAVCVLGCVRVVFVAARSALTHISLSLFCFVLFCTHFTPSHHMTVDRSDHIH